MIRFIEFLYGIGYSINSWIIKKIFGDFINFLLMLSILAFYLVIKIYTLKWFGEQSLSWMRGLDFFYFELAVWVFLCRTRLRQQQKAAESSRKQ